MIANNQCRPGWRSLLALVLVAGVAGPALAQEATGGAWRVDCSGDGKVLECRAVQQLLTREDSKLIVQLVARLAPDPAKAAEPVKAADAKSVAAAAPSPPPLVPTLAVQLPLGINVSEPVALKVDNGKEERVAVQTCTNTGCFLLMPLRDPMMASMRNGTLLKIAFQDTGKRTLNVEVPLLGFGLAYDKATK